MVKDQEINVTLQIVGPIIIGKCEDVKTLQRLCKENYESYQLVLKRLIKTRKQKNEWKQKYLDLLEGKKHEMS